ncbi:MAG: AMP-dependent synthetase/ligase [Bacteroidales bacterium]
MTPTRTFDILDRSLRLFHGKNALAEKEGPRWTYYTVEQYYELAHLFACGLLAMGFQRGDKIITITSNRPQWNIVDMGMAMAGVVHVPVYTSMSQEEYRHIISHSDASMVMVSGQKLLETVTPLIQSSERVKYLYTFNEMAGFSFWMEIVEKGEEAGPACRERLKALKASIKPGDLASIIYTSGTTGISKGVMLSHENLVRNALAATTIFQMTPEDRYLSIIPVCHVGGRMGNYQTQLSGSCIYYAENMGTIAANLKEIRATGFDAVPRILEKIFDNVMARGRTLKGMKKRLFFWAVRIGMRYRHPDQTGWFYRRQLKLADRLIFSKWREALGGKARLVGCGGASLQPRLERIFWASGLKIINMYGLTETSPIITINRQEGPQLRLGTVGSAIDGVEVRIAPDGEILCRGHNVMLGYYKDKDDQLTRGIIDPEGWLHTGDLGHLDQEGFLSVTDRKKEIFKLSSGKYVAPQVLENKLKESPFIDQVMVVGEHQKFTSALILPDFKYLKEWCLSKSLDVDDDRGILVCHPEVMAAYNREVSGINKSLSEWEKISRLRLVTDEWSPGTGELSASLKLKRKVLEIKYRPLLEDIYQRQS